MLGLIKQRTVSSLAYRAAPLVCSVARSHVHAIASVSAAAAAVQHVQHGRRRRKNLKEQPIGLKPAIGSCTQILAVSGRSQHVVAANSIISRSQHQYLSSSTTALAKAACKNSSSSSRQSLRAASTVGYGASSCLPVIAVAGQGFSSHNLGQILAQDFGSEPQDEGLRDSSSLEFSIFELGRALCMLAEEVVHEKEWTWTDPRWLGQYTGLCDYADAKGGKLRNDQVRKWLRDHPHILEKMGSTVAGYFGDHDIDHIFPYAKKSAVSEANRADHPINMFVMPASDNRSFGARISMAKCRYVGLGVALHVLWWHVRQAPQTAPSFWWLLTNMDLESATGAGTLLATAAAAA